MIKQERIQRFGDEVGRRFGAERVILFGSYAQGQPTEDSDVDLLVILDHTQKPWQAANAIRQAVRPPFPLDLLVRTPDQIKDRLAMGDFFIRQILEQGKILYEKSN
jgi:uncharacterized protein